MSIITDILRNFQRAPLVDLDTPHDGLVASPATDGAASHPTDWNGIRRDLAHLRSVLQEALLWLDEIDPTSAGLAAVADVTDLDGKRKGRQSRD